MTFFIHESYNIYNSIMENYMRKICGFILFWLAIGIVIGLYLEASFLSVLTIITMIVLGFFLFQSCN